MDGLLWTNIGHCEVEKHVLCCLRHGVKPSVRNLAGISHISSLSANKSHSHNYLHQVGITAVIDVNA